MAPLLIGLVIFTGAVAVGPSSGGSFNPARSLAPAVYDGEWGDVWIYLVGPFAGAIVGGAVWAFLVAREPARAPVVDLGRDEALLSQGFRRSGWPDSNQRLLRPKRSALPG